MEIGGAMLQKLSLFSGLADSEWLALSDRIQINNLKPNQTIYRVGGISNGMNLVLTGSVRTFVTDRYGVKLTVADVAPGEIFGELPGPTEAVCTSTAVTLQQTQFIVMGREFLSDIFTQNPNAVFPMIAALECHLRRVQYLLRSTKLAR